MAYGPLVEWAGSGRRDEDIAALTQHLTSIIEGWVRETPEQWLWLHRRWKTTPSFGTSSSPGPEGSSISSDARPASVLSSESLASEAVPTPARRSANPEDGA
jgi:hypothetical protein